MSHTFVPAQIAGYLKWDVVERALWTGAEAAIGVLAAYVGGISAWWAVPIGLVLAAVKSAIAGQLGQQGTASTLPASKDPAAAAGPQPGARGATGSTAR